MQFAAISDAGRVRENNEDSYCLGELRAPLLPAGRQPMLMAVADGLGGLSAGEVASTLAIRILQDQLSDLDGDPVGRLRAAILAAHAAILRCSGAGAQDMATTMTATIVSGCDLWWGHVGDSRAYLARGGGLIALTHDHSVTGELLAAGRIGREAARLHPRRHVLTQALGIGDEPLVETGTARLQAGDWLILATDGLTAVLRDEEIAQAVGTSDGPGACCKELVALANARGGPDNVTVIAARA